MKKEFWHDRWESNNIAFHEPTANPLLVKYLPLLQLPKAARVFLPLCGKTLDIAWLLSQGYSVIGAELSELAISQLFAELGVTPEINKLGKITHYRAANIDMFVGDIFDTTQPLIGTVDAVYDRAALVALPKEMRRAYVDHVTKITQNAPQLLICYHYDQNLTEGPPFSIPDEEVFELFNPHYRADFIECSEVRGGLRGKQPVAEKTWILKGNS